MVIVFNTSINRETMLWSKILNHLDNEYRAEKTTSEFKDWVYNKYGIQVFYLSNIIPGISRIDVPDSAVTYLKLRFN